MRKKSKNDEVQSIFLKGIGCEIKDLMICKNISIQELSEMVDISYKTIELIINGCNIEGLKVETLMYLIFKLEG